ncbi:DEXDc helicase [Yasminevirus sp. GU-2018]|uniref:DEXDc helicase n=1 Tax=Yasminevirus sp. GU-2018 TaxID=2420051 RepID=A0A5K0U775_9VIRU|nr:DEXDc helicase [Yasminevirus sp. GU-2018]
MELTTVVKDTLTNVGTNTALNVGSEYLRVIDAKYDPSVHGEYEEEFEKEHFKSSLKWDSFQIHSFQAIKRGDNLLVVAPTSSGKTSVAKYATLFNLLQKHVRVVYTTPIKSLSNEKYEEMKSVLAPYGVSPGLLTGDQKIDVDSRFLIMTAEILSNALFMLKKDDDSAEKSKDEKKHYELDREFVKSIGCVVIDEIHFISDRSRGHHWENTLILLDKNVQIVGLSATIDGPEEFASWIGRIKQKPITLVKKYDRPVPLEYAIFDGENLKTVLDAGGDYNSDAFQSSIKRLKEEEKKHEMNKTDKVNALLNNFIRYAKEKELLQLCFIIFSKKNCERFAENVTVGLVDGKESAIAVRELERKMGIHLKSYETMPRYRQIKALIAKGVCFHHAGIPVIMKEVVEYLFKAGHIKVLFATETVAIGVNMPIRTLVMSSVEKSVGTHVQTLNAAEFKQICGRAGRRGLDKKGLIVFLPLYDLPSEMTVRKDLLFGPMPKIVSNMELTYHSYLKLLQSDVVDRHNFYDNSLLSSQNSKIVSAFEKSIQKQKDEFELAKRELNSFIEDNKVDKNVLKDISDYIKTTSVSAKSLGFGSGVSVQVKLNKQQLKNQKRLEETIKLNKRLYDLTVAYNKADASLKKAQEEQSSYVMYKDDRYGQIAEYLTESGYLTEDGKITEYGKMVAFINECNPFILAEIFTGNILQTMTPQQIVCFLSILTDKITKTNKDDRPLNSIRVDDTIKDAILYVEDRVRSYTDLERRMGLTAQTSDQDYWELSYDYLELADLWSKMDLSTEDHSRILQKLYELDEYEGSFVKNMLKINNIVGNLMTLCNLTQQLDALPNLQEVEKIILKGMVNADSLHVIN